MLLNWLRGWKKQQEMTLRGRTERRRRQRKVNVRPHLEPLEDRTLLSISATPNLPPWVEQGPGPIQNAGVGNEVGAISLSDPPPSGVTSRSITTYMRAQ
jgi:hypothetical protein